MHELNITYVKFYFIFYKILWGMNITYKKINFIFYKILWMNVLKQVSNPYSKMNFISIVAYKPRVFYIILLPKKNLPRQK